MQRSKIDVWVGVFVMIGAAAMLFLALQAANLLFDDKSFQARVTLAMEDRYAFPKDSSLKILTSGLLGEQYIGIEAGSDVKNLVAGDTISSTQSAVVLENLIGQFLYSKAADSSSASVSAPATGSNEKK